MVYMQTFKEFYETDEEVLEEGGQAGHMQAPFEDPNMTIGDLKSLVNDLFDGKIEVTEKLDGQNIAVTWKNGRLGAARNKSTTRDPMTIEDVAKKFAGRGEIEAAFVNSMKDLESAFSKISEDERERIFNGGQNFLNLGQF